MITVHLRHSMTDSEREKVHYHENFTNTGTTISKRELLGLKIKMRSFFLKIKAPAKKESFSDLPEERNQFS